MTLNLSSVVALTVTVTAASTQAGPTVTATAVLPESQVILAEALAG